MIFSIKQEMYKLVHKKNTWIAPIILLLLMIITAYSIGNGIPRLVIMACFDAPDWIMFTLVIVGSTTFSMEFQNNAILTLLYKAKSKIYVYLAKYLVIFIYNVFLHLMAIIYTVLLKMILFPTLKWTMIYTYQQPLWENMLMTMLVDMLTTMLVITVVFLLSCLINNNAVVITVSFLIVLIGQTVSVDLVKVASMMKWNPFNILNLTRQYYNYSEYILNTNLTNLGLWLAAIIYTVAFFIIGYLIFRKKSF